jgi:filamentous hemagglutinin family protein
MLVIKAIKSSTAIGLVIALGIASQSWTAAKAQTVTTAPVVVSDPRTGLDITQNGVPVVNIATPDFNGTSYNVFSRLNVGAEGLVFNNSQVIGQSAIGGTVLANKRLITPPAPPSKKGVPVMRPLPVYPANLIISEVIGGTRSDLLGTIEIFGNRAGLVIANPAGITCDGCGFINVARASLSTGVPVFAADRTLAGFQVNGGAVEVNGRGLSGGNVDYFDIVTGTAKINAALQTRDLVVSGGSQDFKYADRTATARVGSSQLLAIDSTVLGGMYANRIRLIGTGAGVGINLRGLVSAFDGSALIAADGKVIVRNIDASSNIAISSRGAGVRVEEYISSGGSTIINAAENIEIADNVAALPAGPAGPAGPIGPIGPVGPVGSVGTNTLGLLEFSPAPKNITFLQPITVEPDGGIVGPLPTTLPILTPATTSNPIRLTGATIDALGSVILSSGGDIVSNSNGSIYGDTVSLIANQDIILGAGSGIYANNLALNAVRDINLTASTNVRSTAQYTDLGRGLYNNTYLTSTEVTGAQLDSFGSLFLTAGRDLTLEAAALSSNGVIGLTAARDVAIGGIATTGTTSQSWKTSKNVTGNSVETVSNYDGTNITAGSGLFVNAAQEVDITGSSLLSDSGISIWANEGTAYVAGSDISATDDIAFSGRNIVITGSVNSSAFDETVRTVKRGFLSKRTTTAVTSDQIETIFASTISGNRVLFDSARNINILDSNIAGGRAVDIIAGGDITINSIPTSSDTYSATKVKKSGFSIGGGSIFLGVSRTSNVVDTNQISNIGSVIGAALGSVLISAGNGNANASAASGSLDIVGSRIAALDAITLAGNSVDIVNNVNVATTATNYTTSSFGLTLGAQGPLLNALDATNRLGYIAAKTSNARVQAVSLLASGLAIKNGYDAAKDIVTTIVDKKGLLGLSISASIGFNRTTSTSLSVDETIVASQVTGGDISIFTRAVNGESGINIYGSDVAAVRDLRLFSNGGIDIAAAIETDRISGQSQSAGISLGVSLDLALGKNYASFKSAAPTVTLSYNNSSSRYNGIDVSARSSILGAGGTATINTLGTLNLDGSQLSGNRVDISADALNIFSRQNTSTYLSRERNSGFSLSYQIGTGTISGSANFGGGNQSGVFASVADQAGVRAGSGGFDIDVALLTDLRGGVIASTAVTSLNRLRTGTLRVSDLQNTESYRASSFNIGLGFGDVSFDTFGNLTSTASNANLPGINFGNGSMTAAVPSFLYASGNQASLTRSAIAPATILIGINAASAEPASLSALATLSRDTSTANSALTRQFTDAQRVEIAQGFAATRQLITETSVFFANRAAEQTRAEAAALLIVGGVQRDANGNPVRNSNGDLIGLTNEARALINTAAAIRRNYGSGSAARILATALSGAAGANVTGALGSLVQGVAVNALQSLAVTEIKAIADSFFTPNPNGIGDGAPNAISEAVRTALQGLAGCAGAAASTSLVSAGVGGNCSSGALGASASVVLNNLITQLLQPEPRDTNGNIIPRSLSDQQARTQLIATLTGALAGALGGNAGAASTAGVIETENNNFYAGKRLILTGRTGGFTVAGKRNEIARLKGLPQLTAEQLALLKDLEADYNALIKEFRNEQAAQHAVNVDIWSNAASSFDVAYVGSKAAIIAYFDQGGTPEQLALEKKAYLDAQVNAIVAGFELTAVQRSQLLADYNSKRKTAGETLERAYTLSVGDTQALVGVFGAASRDEIQLADMVFGFLPSGRIASAVTTLGDSVFDVKDQLDRINLDSIFANANNAGVQAALAMRAQTNPNYSGGFKVVTFKGKNYFIGKPPLGDPAAGINPSFVDPRHKVGFDGEVRLAQDINSKVPGQYVVSYGNAAGVHVADVVTVDTNGNVTLWDNKVRNNTTGIQDSSALTTETARKYAVDNINASNLPQAVKDKAISNLGKGNYRGITAGDGTGARNSTIQQYSDFKPVDPNRVKISPRRTPMRPRTGV